MSKGFSSASDVIAFHNIETGGNSAGNGGAGSNTGAVSTEANIEFHASTDTGGHVQDSAANYISVWQSNKASSGDATSYGTGSATSGYVSATQSNSSSITATGVHDHASSTTTYTIDSYPTQMVEAGIGGNGGDGNTAYGGDVTIDLTHS